MSASRPSQAGKPDQFVVRAQLPDGTMYAHPGTVNFLDIEADQTTDTITVRAEFANPEGLLVDGEFVNVRVERDKPEERLVVPQPALQLDQAGSPTCCSSTARTRSSSDGSRPARPSAAISWSRRGSRRAIG